MAVCALILSVWMMGAVCASPADTIAAIEAYDYGNAQNQGVSQ
jgi:hypothetical protein